MSDASLTHAQTMDRKERLVDQNSGDRSKLARISVFLLLIALIMTIVWSMTSGASDASVFAVLKGLFFSNEAAGISARDNIIIFDIRLPRIYMGELVGAALAVYGAVKLG